MHVGARCSVPTVETGRWAVSLKFQIIILKSLRQLADFHLGESAGADAYGRTNKFKFQITKSAFKCPEGA